MSKVIIRESSFNLLGRKSRECTNIGISLVLSSLLILQSLITAPLLLQTDGSITGAGNSVTEVIKYTFIHSYGEPALLSELSEPDRQHKLRTGAAEQGIRDVRRLISRIFQVVSLSVAGIWVLRSIRQCIMTRKERCGSVLALSIGGHAPPV